MKGTELRGEGGKEACGVAVEKVEGVGRIDVRESINMTAERRKHAKEVDVRWMNYVGCLEIMKVGGAKEVGEDGKRIGVEVVHDGVLTWVSG